MNFLALNFTRQIAIVLTAVFGSVFSANAVHIDNLNNDYEITRISGNSMLPTLRSGETAIVYKAYPFKNLRVGDVVIIESKRGFKVIHRIVRRYRGSMWVTQGDNNRREDREVLSTRNFGGLALVDQSVQRYQTYLANMNNEERFNTEKPATVALAHQESSETRLSKLRRL